MINWGRGSLTGDTDPQARQGPQPLLPNPLTHTHTPRPSVPLRSISPLMGAHLLLHFAGTNGRVRRHIEALQETGRSGRETLNGYITTAFLCGAVNEVLRDLRGGPRCSAVCRVAPMAQCLQGWHVWASAPEAGR